LADPAVPKSLEVALARITYDDALLRDVARSLLTTARPPDAHTLYRRHTVPGIGKMLRLVLLYDVHAITRFPRGQDCLSYCRLGKCRQASAGKCRGTSGAKIGNAPLQWTFSDAAVLCLSDHPAAQPDRARLANTHGTGKA
jgi:transposase